MNAELEKLPKVYGGAQVYLSGALNDIGKRAESTASGMKDEYVSTEHLLLAMADDFDKSSAGKLLRDLGVTRDRCLTP